jgi:hypothetical protein
MHPIDSNHNTTFFLKLIGSNISLWCYFLIDFYLNIFRNMLSSGFQHSVRQKALWKTDQFWNRMFQRSQILDELILPAHTESSVTFSSRSAPARDSVVFLLYHLADHLYRGFRSVDDLFWARRLKWLKMFSFFRCEKLKWLKFRKCDILEVLFFSYVDLSFWGDTLLLFLLFWILVIVVFSYTLFTLCPFETKRGSIFVLDRECIFKPVKCFLS